MTQKITPFLWFDGKAEEAMNFYVSIFKNSKTGTISRYGEADPGPKGTVMSVTFQLDGQEFFALNGGSAFAFSPAISFLVNCETQKEIIPRILGELLNHPVPAKSNRVMQAMMQMTKIEIKGLQQAAHT